MVGYWKIGVRLQICRNEPQTGTYAATRCRSCGVETKREAGRYSVKSLKVSFSPSPELKKYFDLKNCILVEKRESQEEAEEA